MAQPLGAAAAPARRVTLITGDQVWISDDRGAVASIRRAPGRENLRFVTQRVTVPGQGARLYVIPEDAAKLIAAGKVDRRLFDVTLLLEFGYDDARRQDLPFIVTYERQAAGVAGAPRSVAGARVERSLPSVNGQAIVAPKASVGQVWRSVVSGRGAGGSASALASEPIGAIWLDGLLKPTLDRSVAQIGAPAAWALGYEGDGVVVGVLDTGIDATHPDLADAVIVSRNFTDTPDVDTIGHGTHVASIIAGSGAAEDGLYRGVAPGAQLLAAKVCEDSNCSESSIIAGAQWVVAEEGARVVNVSLGGADAPGYDPLEEAISTLTAQYGALFVISAGNSGSSNGTIGSPGSVAAALTVGAVDHDDQIAAFSSRGMTADGAIKPDLTAPGVDIVAARAQGTELGARVGEDYVMASGTSMAAPHVAGVAALLIQRNPLWSAADIESALVGSASYNPTFGALDQGTGRVDVPAALEVSLLSSTPSVSFGVAEWPHDDDGPVTRTVTYRNLGAEAQLAFELDVRGPDGAPVPEGMFSLEPSTLTIPAGGTAAVKVTANPRLGGVDGVFGGRLLASDGASRSISVSLGLVRESESYSVTFRYTDREGQPANGSGILLGGEPFVQFVEASPAQPEPTLRLAKGEYTLESFVDAASADTPTTLLLAPNLAITEETRLELDARTAAPVTLTLPVAGTLLDNTTLSYDLSLPAGGLSSTIGFGAAASPAFYAGLIGASEAPLEFMLQGLWNTLDSPDVYTAGWLGDGTLPSGDFVVDASQLATVHASYAGFLGASPTDVVLGLAAYRAGSGSFGFISPDVRFPLERTEYYYSTHEDLRWITNISAFDESIIDGYALDGAPSQYLAGQTYAARFNAPIHAIALPEVRASGTFASRAGDRLRILPSVYADSDGHHGDLPTEGQVRLYRNGELFAEAEAGRGAAFDVPPELASYRFELDTSQSRFELSTRQRIIWTLESEHVADGETVRPPLLTARFDASLNEAGRAPRGPFLLPFRIAQYGRIDPEDVSVTAVEVSYDDGVTWAAGSVEPNAGSWTVAFEHPASGDYVSLRVSARDTRGNAVEQTVIRAYGLARDP